MVELKNIKLLLPIDAKYPVTQPFGANPDMYKQYGYPGHNGKDYGCPIGTPVSAAAAGLVQEAGANAYGYGNWVKLDHDGWYTVYAHLSKAVVSKGTMVQAGDIIGYSGNTGNSTGPHLHFELRVPGHGAPGYSSGALDPTPFFVAQATAEPPSQPLPSGAVEIIDIYGANIRSSSDLKPDNIVAVAPKGAVAYVEEQVGSFYKIKAFVHETMVRRP